MRSDKSYLGRNLISQKKSTKFKIYQKAPSPSKLKKYFLLVKRNKLGQLSQNNKAKNLISSKKEKIEKFTTNKKLLSPPPPALKTQTRTHTYTFVALQRTQYWPINRYNVQVEGFCAQITKNFPPSAVCSLGKFCLYCSFIFFQYPIFSIKFLTAADNC